ncbi:cytochrome b562 family protein, partial [Vibrio cholerae]
MSCVVASRLKSLLVYFNFATKLSSLLQAEWRTIPLPSK